MTNVFMDTEDKNKKDEEHINQPQKRSEAEFSTAVRRTKGHSSKTNNKPSRKASATSGGSVQINNLNIKSSGNVFVGRTPQKAHHRQKGEHRTAAVVTTRPPSVKDHSAAEFGHRAV